MNGLNKRNLVLTLAVIIVVAGTGYFIITGLAPSNSSVAEVKAIEGNFMVPIYSYSTNMLTYENLSGVEITINNIDEQSLTIVSISNSTYLINNPLYYEYQQVVAPNGSIVYAYVRTYEIYLGVNTIVIPIHLSPGLYTVLFNDGNSIQIMVHSASN